jgi:outer membrane lipoprotein-sorting protein
VIGVAVLFAQLSAGAIVAQAKQVDLKIQDVTARAHMEIASRGETKKRTFDLMLRREGVNYRALITLVEPLATAGTRFLIVAERGKRNRQWAYFPALELVRSIKGRDQDDAFLGSDITYADLAGGAHIDDLVHRLLTEEDVDGAPCYVMEGVPRHKTSYGKLQGWVRRDNYVTIRARFFDREMNPIKEAHLGDVREVEGVLLAHRIEVSSMIEDSQTVLTLREVRVNQGLAPELFTESALEGK